MYYAETSPGPTDCKALESSTEAGQNMTSPSTNGMKGQKRHIKGTLILSNFRNTEVQILPTECHCK